MLLFSILFNSNDSGIHGPVIYGVNLESNYIAMKFRF